MTGKPHARGNLSAVLTKPTSAIMELGRIECEGISLIPEPMRKEALRLAGAGSAHTAGYGLYPRLSRLGGPGLLRVRTLATPNYDEPPVESLSFTFHQIDLF